MISEASRAALGSRSNARVALSCSPACPDVRGQLGSIVWSTASISRSNVFVRQLVRPAGHARTGVVVLAGTTQLSTDFPAPAASRAGLAHVVHQRRCGQMPVGSAGGAPELVDRVRAALPR